MPATQRTHRQRRSSRVLVLMKRTKVQLMWIADVWVGMNDLLVANSLRVRGVSLLSRSPLGVVPEQFRLAVS